MREIFVGETEISGRRMEYYILSEPQGELEDYGVAIRQDGERACVRRLTPIAGRVLALVERLRSGSVTPVALEDVVNDWLLE